ncbi:MAG: exo-alpha-sialidase [Planctomycetaceae bacterium]|nr:exo-alpha-sialidase [Planctomycetaceae bacterium]
MRPSLLIISMVFVFGLTSFNLMAQDVPTDSFEDVPAGAFEEITTSVGRWVVTDGRAVIDDRHAKTGRQCLQLTGGEKTSATLYLSEGVATPAILSFHAERWTSRPPFSFRIEQLRNGEWQEIHSGDSSVRVGRAFLNSVEVTLAESSISALRFTCVSPPETGILIDDLRVAPPLPQTIESVERVPLTLPALIGVDTCALVQLRIRTRGSLSPISLTGIRGGIQGVTQMDSLFLSAPSGPSQRLSLPENADALMDWKLNAVVLSEGENLVTVRCRLRPDADIDQQVGAFVKELTFSDGTLQSVEAARSLQRIGVAVRQGGDDDVHTYRIPGLATTNSGTLIGVYDVRRRSGGDLPGDIDVGMSRSTDGGRSWQPMQIIMDMGSDPKWNHDGIGDPAVLVDRVTGTIWVAATWSHGNRSWNGSGPGLAPEETGQLMLVRSDDDGVTWSDPINITAQVKRPEWCFLLQGPGKGITMRDGTLVFAAQYQDPPDQKRLPHSTIIYSQDHGQTWHAGTGAFDDTTEAQVVEVEPGVLMLNCRYNRKSARVVMTTRDMGQTWQKHPTSERSLIEPGACMASLIDVDQEVGADVGGWLLFSNPDSRSGRNHITIKASPDGGKSWPAESRLLLDEGNSAGYSCLSMIDQNTIGILYEGSQAQMTFQRIPLDAVLKSGRTAVKDAVSRATSDARTPERPLDIFVLTGQSNALGTVAPADLEQPLPPSSPDDARIPFFWSNRSTRSGDGQAVLIGDSGGMFRQLQAQQGEGANPVFWGPEVGFARRLLEQGQADFAMIKAARGGGGNSFWKKGAPDDHMYRHVVSTVSQAVKAIPDGRRFRIRAIVYLQGESDSDAEAEAAGERLLLLLRNLRRDLPYAEEAKLLVAGIAAAGGRRDLVRIQQAAAANGCEDLSYLETTDLRDQLYDQLHFGKDAKLLIGRRLADQWQSGIGNSDARLQLPPVFGSHMVLQADAPLPVWGTAVPGSLVEVEFGSERLTTTAAASGEWQVRLSSRPPTTVPETLIIRSGHQQISCRDVLIGDVWVCAGQSNMEWPLQQSTHGAEELRELAAAEESAVRLLDLTDGPRGVSGSYTRGQLTQLTPATFVDGQWKEATVDSVSEFSAVAWYFGSTMHRRLKRPIGMICPAVGGSPAEAWIPREALEADPELPGLVAGHWLDNPLLGDFSPDRGEQNLLEAMHNGETIPGDSSGPNHPFKPGFLWSAGIAPLIPYSIRGVIWYQGESNAETSLRVQQHEHLFPLLVTQWRQHWGLGDFPFVYVQLPAMERSEWPLFRDGQRRMLNRLNHVAMAITIDTGDRTDVHPRLKKPVGQRLALAAMGIVRESPDEPGSATFSGPLLQSVRSEGGTVALTFTQCGTGLRSRDGAPLRHFELAGSDGRFYPAVATVTGHSQLIVASEHVPQAVQVRYGWIPWPDPPVNLCNDLDLPASPFSAPVERAEMP